MTKEFGQAIIASEAIKLAKSLPAQLIQLLGSLINNCDLNDWPASRTQIIQNISHPEYRTQVARFLDTWQSHAGEVSSQSVTISLLTAAASENHHRGHQSLELVWTGPDTSVFPLRRTEQALLQLIATAKQRLLIVSYAVYNIAHICEALIRAANRGLLITIIIEASNRLEAQNAYNTLKAFGSEVVNRCSIYIWPPERRERDAKGKLGALHVKCAVADGQLLLISSANLTEYAFTINMELGLLVEGGAIPEQIENHFHQMIQSEVLVSING